MAQISTEQTKTLRSLASQYLPGGDDGYRSFLWETFPGKDWGDRQRPSTLDLTRQEANDAIQALLRLKRSLAGAGAEAGERPVPTGYGRPWEGRYDARGGLTQKQADELGRLEWKLGWHTNPERLRSFIQRTAGERKNAGALTKAQASDCITALRDLAGE
jgi:hypothetical protein